MADRPPRPQALTLTCIFVGVGCALLLVNLVSALGSWGSIALQDAVRDALAEEPVRELGISVDQALDYLRYAAYVGVVLTASGLVFSVYVARGHRASRIMLSILCAVAFLAFAALGLPGLLPALFAGLCGWSLWTPEARRWFDQVDGRAVPAAASADARSQAPVPPSTSRPSDPFAPVPPSQVPEAPVLAAADPAPSAPATAAPAGDRPRSVTTAVVTTVVSCAVVGLFSAAVLLMSTVGADAYRAALEEPGAARDLMRASDVDADQILRVMPYFSGAWLAVSVAGLLAAIFAARRSKRGATALVATAAVSIVVSVPMVLSLVGIVTIGLAVLVIVQVNQPDARAWFRRE